MEIVTTVYYVRHVQAAGNLARRFQGHINTDISELVARQLDELGGYFADIELDHVYTSPLIRAYKTASAVVAGRDIPLTTDDRLKELSAGEWEDYPIFDMPKHYPDHWDRWNNHFWDFTAPGGESIEQLCGRMSDALTDIVAANTGGTVCIVSHGCALRSLTNYILGLRGEQFGNVGWLHNAGVSKLLVLWGWFARAGGV